MSEKLFEEEIDKYDEDRKSDIVKKNKKRFNWKIFLVALVGGLVLNFDMEIAGWIITIIATVLTIAYHKKYKMWPQLIIIIPMWILSIWYYFVIATGQVEISAVHFMC